MGQIQTVLKKGSSILKLIWEKGHNYIILIAETRAEVAFCEVFVSDLIAHKFKETRQGQSIIKAKWVITPDEVLSLSQVVYHSEEISAT